MAKAKRREFIKKSLLAGILARTTISSYSSAFDRPKTIPRWQNGVDTETYWNGIRSLFTLTRDRVYMNCAGLGPSPEMVQETFFDWTRKIDFLGESMHNEIEKVRIKFSKFLNTDTAEIAFTRNATEGVNIVARSLKLKKGDEVILSTHEHVGGASPWLMLKEEIGIKIKLVDLDLTGESNLEKIKVATTSKTKVLFISHLTCTTGMILPVKELVDYCRETNIYTCIDGAQALGMIKVDLGDLQPDFYVASGHKWLFGPKGSGILYINKNTISSLRQVFAGAYANTTYDLNKMMMEFSMKAERVEYGTRNSAHIKALEAAVDFIADIGIDRIEERGKELHSLLFSLLSDQPEIQILSPEKDEFRSAIFTFRHQSIDYLKLQNMLATTYKFRLRGIYENDLNAVRISCAVFNSRTEIEQLAKAILEVKND